METSLYVGLSRQVVLEQAMRLVSNNIANANTTGYRAQNPTFAEYLSDEKYSPEQTSMVTNNGQYFSTEEGVIQHTGNPYDVALNGPGFMSIQTSKGDTLYTRAGNFTVNQNSELVTTSGDKVVGTGGNAIAIPASAKEVKITDEGEVTADGNVVGRIGIVEFANIQTLTPEGDGLYRAAEAGTPAINTKVIQAALEGSNVNAIRETTRMIDILRSYQSTLRMLYNEQERQVSSIRTLAKVNS